MERVCSDGSIDIKGTDILADHVLLLLAGDTTGVRQGVSVQGVQAEGGLASNKIVLLCEALRT